MQVIPQYDFPTNPSEIEQRLQDISPKTYARTRNFVDGDVTYLSPYISRGVLSTKQVLDVVLQKGLTISQCEKFVQELAWRDYWQRIWQAKGDAINEDLKREQQPISNYEVPTAIVNAQTGIIAIDEAIIALYDKGYMHNHIRMYVAGIVCNMSYSYWKMPAQWMYYHLLDADWASNALSWQWVAGANASKKYVANQANINKYTHSNQQQTFLDVEYSAFNHWTVPAVLQATEQVAMDTPLPTVPTVQLDAQKETALYNWYNLDYNWLADKAVNRVLLLEPSIFQQYPIGQLSMQFMLDLAKNIKDVKIIVAEFAELQNQYPSMIFHYKEHPLNHYTGVEHHRDWIGDVQGYFPSFFRYWKKVKQQLLS